MRVPSLLRRRPRDAARALALGFCAFAAGCGGDDGGDPTSAITTGGAATATQHAPPSPAAAGRQRLIEAAIRGALASDDPAVACREAVSAVYVQESYGDEVGCRQAIAAGGIANSVRVEAVGASGGTASALATPSGGPSDGEQIEVELVHRGGGWKVDSVISNAPVGP